MFIFEDPDDLKEYQESIRSYIEKIEIIKNMKSFVLTKKGFKYSPEAAAEIFNIKGTRIFLIVKKCYWPPGIGEYFKVALIWQVKKKNKKEYIKITLEDVLDSSLIPNKAKEEIVFNLNAFLT